MKLRKLFLAVLAGAALLTACDKKEVDLGPAKLTVNPTDVAFEQDMDSKDISLVATRDWAVTGLPDWIALSKEAGSANPDAQKVVISVTQNEGYNRSATLTFSIGFARSVLHVTQAGPDGEVDNGDGSKTNPYNVEGVIAFVTALGDKESENNVYVKGKISAISEEYSTQYGNGAFTISDDGTTESPQFTAYRVLYLGNKKFASGDTQIKVGDDVILYGKVVNYKGNTPETAQGAAFLFSLNGVDKGGDGGSTGDAKGTGTLEDPYNPAGAAAAVASLTWTDKDNYEKTEPVYIKGKISKVTTSFEASGSYGNASFTIVDETDGTGSFEVFQTYYLGNRQWKTGDTEIKENDVVIVYGPIMNYKGNTPETVGKGASYIYSLNGTTDGGGQGGGTGTPSGTGVKDDPFNVAAAIAKAKETGETVTADEYYIKGTVSTVSLSAQFKNADLDLVDAEGGEVFKAFRIKGFDGADITGTEPIKKGDVVVVCGKIVNFKGNTPETDQGGKLITWNDKTSFDGQGGGGGDTGDAIVIDFSTKGYANGTQYPSTVQDGITVTFGGGANDGKYYNTGSAMRIYGNGYVQISAEKTITKIVFTWDGSSTSDSNGAIGKPDDAFPATVDGGTYDQASCTWTGSAASIKMSRGAGSGHWRLQKLAVTVEGGGQGGEGGGGEGGDTPVKPVNEGTLESPYTVADALIAAKDADLAGKEYYVKAVVGKDVNIKNGVASFELMDGTTDGKLTVVKAKSFGGKSFTGSEPLDWLDEVVLKGKVTEYSTLPALTEGQIVKWNGKPTFLDPETDLSKIIALADKADAYFDAVVAAVTTKSIVVTDGTNNVYVFSPATMPVVGDKVRILGQKEIRNGMGQITSGAELTVLESGKTVTPGEAKDITATFDAYPASTTKNEYITFTGTLSVSGNYYNVAVEDAATYTGSIAFPVEALGLAALSGKKVVFTGYYVGTSGSSTKYLNVVCTKAEEFTQGGGGEQKEPFEIVFASNSDVTSNGVTISCKKGTGSSAPAWVASAGELRLYLGNTITATSESNIAKIEYYFHKQGSKAWQSVSMTSTEGTYTDCEASTSATDSKVATWTGSSKSIVLALGTVSGGQRVLEKVVITLE